MSSYRSVLMSKLGLAEIYLEDGASSSALLVLHESLEIASPALAESEDLGDVSTHLLERMG